MKAPDDLHVPRDAGPWAAGAAVAGLLILNLLWSSELAASARVSFSAHMLLHLCVMILAAPLLAYGLARLAPRKLPRIGIAGAAVLSLLEMAVVWGWHLPGLHEAASLNPTYFALQQASFLAAGIAVWLPGFARRDRSAAVSGAVGLALGFMHMSMLGVILAVSPTLFYDPALCSGAFGLDPLGDQRLGGVLMALGGGLPYLLGATVFLYRLLVSDRDGDGSA